MHVRMFFVVVLRHHVVVPAAELGRRELARSAPHCLAIRARWHRQNDVERFARADRLPGGIATFIIANAITGNRPFLFDLGNLFAAFNNLAGLVLQLDLAVARNVVHVSADRFHAAPSP
ncbi:hypothetical protein WT92_16190 [Burkholderia stagnalis]|nr:hypothetical protein WT91_29605 [Burkholderia stagnalis]KWN96025.1 hypothetical protein WT92_16190 [Burkholderia stagnalis]